MACWDQKRRPGLTLSISATLAGDSGHVPNVAAGEELHFVSRKLKTGRQLGYMELEVWRGSPSDAQYFGGATGQATAGPSSASSAELLAVGRHLKMLAMPAPLLSLVTLADAAGQSRFFPLFQPAALRLFEARYPTVKQWIAHEPTTREEILPPLSRAAKYAADGPPLRVTDTGAPSAFAAPLSPLWSNVLGNMHGGAACLLGEQLAAASYAQSMGVESAPPARMLHVQLLSALVCDGRHAALEAVTSPARSEEAASTLATLRHATDAARAVECTAWWAADERRLA